MARILIIEDDADIAAIERDYLEINDFEVAIAATGTQGIELATKESFDLILLDIMLPEMNGFDVCRQIRNKIDIPILMVTAHREDIDKILGLGLGADDYIEKPFSPGVLIAKIKSHLSQYQRLTSKNKKGDIISLGDIELNTKTHRVFVRGEEKILKNKEFQLLEFLMLNPDAVFSRSDLYNEIWDMDSIGDTATVAVHINRLREIIEVIPSSPKHIQTVWGVGYKFIP